MFYRRSNVLDVVGKCWMKFDQDLINKGANPLCTVTNNLEEHLKINDVTDKIELLL